MMILVALALVQNPEAAQPAPAQPQQEGPTIIELHRPDGNLAARAMIWQGRTGLEVRVQAAGLSAGQYGAHLHAVGRCEGPGFESAGAHWNPTGRAHGKLNPGGHHLGDLDNLEVDASGAGRLEFTIAGAATSGEGGLLDADGAAIVIHAAPDDYRTDPSGNSGARIACGAFARNP